MWGCVLSGYPGHSGGLDSLISTKTSRFVVQSGGRAFRSEMIGDQVISTLFLACFFLFELANLQSMSSLVVIVFIHRVVVVVLL